MSSDSALLSAIARGDLASFEAFYVRHRNQVFRFALGVSGSHSLAEDATQETFMQVMDTAPNFDPTRSHSAKGWVYGICRNRLRSLLRQIAPPASPSGRDTRDVTQDTRSQTAEPPTQYEWSRSAELIAAAMQGLPLAQREVLTLCGLQELDYQSAADILDLPVGTVRSRLARSRAALRSALSTHMDTTLEEIGSHASE